jgi:hypothetical protein
MQRSTEEGPCDRKGGAFSLRPQRSFVRAENNMQVKSTAMSARAHDIAAVKFPLRFRPTYRNYVLHKIKIRIILRQYFAHSVAMSCSSSHLPGCPGAATTITLALSKMASPSSRFPLSCASKVNSNQFRRQVTHPRVEQQLYRGNRLVVEISTAP